MRFNLSHLAVSSISLRHLGFAMASTGTGGEELSPVAVEKSRNSGSDNNCDSEDHRGRKHSSHSSTSKSSSDSSSSAVSEESDGSPESVEALEKEIKELKSKLRTQGRHIMRKFLGKKEASNSNLKVRGEKNKIGALSSGVHHELSAALRTSEICFRLNNEEVRNELLISYTTAERLFEEMSLEDFKSACNYDAEYQSVLDTITSCEDKAKACDSRKKELKSEIAKANEEYKKCKFENKGKVDKNRTRRPRKLIKSQHVILNVYWMWLPKIGRITALSLGNGGT